MQEAFEAANDQMVQVLRGNQALNLPLILAALNDRLVAQFDGWVYHYQPVHHRRARYPEGLYKQVSKNTRDSIASLIEVTQIEVNDVWYCLEKAKTPEEDTWEARITDLFQYLQYRILYQNSWKTCAMCQLEPDYCKTHHRGIQAFTPGKDYKELLTHEDWCNIVLTLIRNTEIDS